MKTITDAQKIYELSKIWEEAAYNFAFWDKVNMNWDEEYKKALPRVLKTKDLYDYYRELKRFVALLKDSRRPFCPAQNPSLQAERQQASFCQTVK